MPRYLRLVPKASSTGAAGRGFGGGGFCVGCIFCIGAGARAEGNPATWPVVAGALAEAAAAIAEALGEG
jgi:hypothetical protein